MGAEKIPPTQAEALARRIRDALGPFNDPNEPVQSLVEKLAERALSAAPPSESAPAQPATAMGEDDPIENYGATGSWISDVFQPLPTEEAAALRAVSAPGFEDTHPTPPPERETPMDAEKVVPREPTEAMLHHGLAAAAAHPGFAGAVWRSMYDAAPANVWPSDAAPAQPATAVGEADLPAIADELVREWIADEKIPKMAWGFREFAAEAMRRALLAHPTPPALHWRAMFDEAPAQPATAVGEAVEWQTLGADGTTWCNITRDEYDLLRARGIGKQRALYTRPTPPTLHTAPDAGEVERDA